MTRWRFEPTQLLAKVPATGITTMTFERPMDSPVSPLLCSSSEGVMRGSDRNQVG